jgi:hypothetical protein
VLKPTSECRYCRKRPGEVSCGDGSEIPFAPICTRPAGHDGPHVACCEGEHNVVCWENERQLEIAR